MILFLLAACSDTAEFDPREAFKLQDQASLDAAWAMWLDALEAELEDEDVPSIAAVVVHEGQIIETVALGTRIEGASTLPADVDTVYRWGSVSKMHTAVGVLLADEQKWLDLDDPIRAFVPDFNVQGGGNGQVTLARLLTHHGDLPDELDWNCDTDDAALPDYYAEWRPELQGEAGAYFNYSNSGFNLLGTALQLQSGQAFPDWMKDEVLAPMGMATATYRAEQTDAGDRATGHAHRDEGVRQYPLREYDCAISRPAAWLHGSVEDMGASLAFFLDDSPPLLDAETVAAMADQADTHLFPDASYRVGQGQFSWDFDGYRVVEHDGFVSGFVSEWAIVPEEELGLAVVANAEWADVQGLLLAGLGAYLHGDSEVDWPPDFSTPVTDWERHAGTYDDPYTWGEVVVVWSEEGLEANFLDLDHQSPLEQRWGDTFRFEDPDGDRQSVRFVDRAPDDAHPTWFVNRYGVGTRVP